MKRKILGRTAAVILLSTVLCLQAAAVQPFSGYE